MRNFVEILCVLKLEFNRIKKLRAFERNPCFGDRYLMPFR